MDRIIPLGGLGEIGANMVAFEGEDAGFIIDVGILFPDTDIFEVNYLIPSFDQLSLKKFNILFITHAHEDHLGALYHALLWNKNLKVYLSPLAMKMAQKKIKLEEHLKCLHVWHAEQEISVQLGAKHTVSVTSLLVDHSIPETYGVLMKDPQRGVGIFYCSDFKSGVLTKSHNFKKLLPAELYPYRLAMLDSTSCTNPGVTHSEEDLLPGLERLMAQKNQRLFMTFFPSNLERLNNIIAVAKKHGRRVFGLGRSVLNAREVALSTHLATFAETDLIDVDAMERGINLDAPEHLFLVSGCQADFFSALRRLTWGEDPRVKLRAGDQMIFSSRIIPGNENQVVAVYNRLAEQGVEIVTANDLLIHCSGHASQGDLAVILDQEAFNIHLPIHGESYLLKHQADWVHQRYGHQLQSLLMFNGEQLSWHRQQHRYVMEKNTQWEKPKLFLSPQWEIDRSQVSERRKLAGQGLVVVSVVTTEGAPHRTKVKFTFKGLVLELEDRRKVLEQFVIEFLQTTLLKETPDIDSKCELLRVALRREVNKYIAAKPVTIVHWH